MQSGNSIPSKRTSRWHKPLLFALFAAVGCLGAAALGEVWLALTSLPVTPPPPPPKPPAQAVVLVLDTSGSMMASGLFGENPLDDMKQSALAYIDRQDMSRTRIGIVSFNSISGVRAPLTNDKAALKLAIEGLQSEGLTRMDLGLQTGLQLLQDVPEIRNILLFTDGVPAAEESWLDPSAMTIGAAQAIRQNGVRLLAIATGDADTEFLAQVTGDRNRVFWASSGQFGEAFQAAERVMAPTTTRQLLDSAPVQGNSQLALLRIAVWTGLLGMGIAIALLMAQKRYTHHVFSVFDLTGVIGGLVVGCLAGGFGQVFFEATSGAPFLSGIARVAAWALLGTGLGWGMGLFIPNLPRGRSALGGALGGSLGAIGFLYFSSVTSDWAGRWVGAALLGGFIGLMVVLAEVASRKAWLRVSYGPADAFDINLGITPIVVGSDRNRCRVLAREVAPVIASYSFENGQTFFQDGISGQRVPVQSGDQRTYGNVTITVQEETAEAIASSRAILAPSALAGSIPAVPPVQSVSQALRSGGPPLAAGDSSSVAGDSAYYSSAPAHVASSVAAAPPVPPGYAQQGQNGGIGSHVGAAPPVIRPVVRAPIVWKLDNPQAPIRLPDSDGQWNMGRDSQNEIVIADVSVSSRHAILGLTHGVLMITDIGSTNGTMVNGHKIRAHTPTVLQNGDVLKLGMQTYTIVAIQ
jgi:Ca-activated chloride channel family protein